ncbi:MAG: purine-nucleoside phosphorylase [Ardenticatenaceae bacterium]|nr:purine-nucleoside phosphorylase [Ardenticatenaceae bacterium]HBY93634.1 purine-nucleoside phosphorylase [Chloroflexota bacterium]
MVRPALAEYHAAARFIRAATHQRPTIGIITGSGLGALADRVAEPESIFTTDIPGWPVSTVEGHAGRLVFGRLGGTAALVMQGRIHFYEGYSMQALTMPIRVMQLLGIKTLVVTNAAGGLNPAFDVGDLMLIKDHINLPGLSGHNPLIGPNEPTLGPRFPNVAVAYTPALRALAHEVAGAQGLALREGIYVMVGGPSFETRAEVRFLRLIGADAVGMSTAAEVVVASHAGMQVLGLSLISNRLVPDSEALEATSHEEVLRAGQVAAPRLLTLVEGLFHRLGQAAPPAADSTD